MGPSRQPCRAIQGETAALIFWPPSHFAVLQGQVSMMFRIVCCFGQNAPVGIFEEERHRPQLHSFVVYSEIKIKLILISVALEIILQLLFNTISHHNVLG